MKILFLHQNFPGQFLHLAPELQKRGHQVRALTDQANTRPSPVPLLRYRHVPERVDPKATRLGRNYTVMSDRGVSVARACAQLRAREGYVPDVIFGHSGWGETLFLKQVWPEAKLLIYAEFYYQGRGADVGFDREFGDYGLDQILIAQGRAAHLAQSLVHADRGLSPTKWQASTYPESLQPMIDVIHDGVDCQALAPDPQAHLYLPDGRILRAGDEVLTFVNRNLEPYRGYHIFMRALPAVLRARPDAQVVILGGDEVSYGTAPKGEKGWKQRILSEVEADLDMSRVHFLDRVPYAQFQSILKISRVHAYLTYPFVLSWSMLEAMAAGCLVVGSDTAPVREVLTHGETGLLVDFFDIDGWSRQLTEALAHLERFDAIRQAARDNARANYDLQSICLPRMVDLVEGLGT